MADKRCIDCGKTYDILFFNKKDYLKRGIESAKKNKKIVKEYILQVKKDNPCQCGEGHPACLQFHHINPSTKIKPIGQMVSEGRSLSKIKKEISKCIVLCANCHAKLHYDEKLKKNNSNNSYDAY